MLFAIACGLLIGTGGLLLLPQQSRHDRIAAIRTSVSRANSSVSEADLRNKIDAIATWTEQLRDTISAAGGLEQAIVATQDLSPLVVRPHIKRLVADIHYGGIEIGLRRFADAVDHEMCDFVVAALLITVKFPARDVAQLLTHLATCAREESRMHLRVWVGRARTRSAVRIVKVVVIVFITGLAVFDLQYLKPFASAQGVVILGLIGAMFVGAFQLLKRLARVDAPFRFIARREVPS